MIPLPVPPAVPTWDPSTCTGDIFLENNNSTVLQRIIGYVTSHSMVLGAESVSRFSATLGTSLGAFASMRVGFITSASFKSSLPQRSLPQGWCVTFSNNGGEKQHNSYAFPFLPGSTVTAIHRASRGDINFKLTSKEGEDMLECNFHRVSHKNFHPFFACTYISGSNSYHGQNNAQKVELIRFC